MDNAVKKARIFLFFLVLAAVSPFAVEAQDRQIFIEGTAISATQQSFFMDNFRTEAIASGYTVADDVVDAGYSFKFDVVRNIIVYEDGSEEEAPPNEKQFIINISLIRNMDDFEIVFFNFPFTNLDEMLEYTQYLFFKATVNISRSGVVRQDSGQDTAWQNKWIYLRASAGFLVSSYGLKSDGLYAGQAMYAGDIDNPGKAAPLDNKILMLPALTLGVEIQFLNWMSLEVNLQGSLGAPDGYDFFNAAAGAELKFPVKLIENLVIEPYAAFLYPLNISPAFAEPETPAFAVGGGLQIGIKGGSNGSFFVDLNYMHYPDDALLKNAYREVYPNPNVIHYQHFTFGFGAGYKYGFFNRNKR